MANSIAIYGAGGFGKEVRMLINQINKTSYEWNFIGFFDDDENLGDKCIGGISKLNDFENPIAVVIAISKPKDKKEVVSSINNKNIWLPKLIHPSALCGVKVSIGEGSIITAGTIITEDVTIGSHVILNLNCTIGHDVNIGSFASLMPAVNISGEVKIKESVYIGTGTQILNGLTIGENSIIGAGAVVTEDIPPNCTAVGVPAKPVKFHSNS